MSKIILALTISGLEKTELTVCLLFLDMIQNEQYGEVPGRNIRQLLDLTKDKLFSVVESLVAKNIIRYMKMVPAETIYLKAGDGFYVFNKRYETWIPSENSLFYKMCKASGWRFNEEAWKHIVDSYDLRKEVEKKVTTEERLTPYQLYDTFCGKYKALFNKEYKPTHIEKDLAYCKQVICGFSYRNYKDSQILEFINWAFKVKAKDFKGDFIVGFLPTCQKDYFASVIVTTVKSGYTKDEDGNIRKVE